MIVHAKNLKGSLVSIANAESKTDYFIDSNVYIAKKGDLMRHHFALKNGNGGVDGHFVTNESLEHYNTKMMLAYNKVVEVDDVTIIAHRSDTEVKIDNRIIDVVFYDVNNEILCLIEVVKTSDLTSDKKEELTNYNIIRYDINNGERIEFIPRRTDINLKISFNERIRKIKGESQREYEELESRFSKSQDGRFNITRKARERNTGIEEEIRDYDGKIQHIINENSIEGIAKRVIDCEQKIEHIKGEIKDIEKELDTTRTIKRKIEILA